MWRLDYVKPDSGKGITSNQFTVSESGALGISCDESPSLSVMYPDTDKAPVILSKYTIYRSATFVKFRRKEYLAAACLDNGCLHLWDVVSKTYRTVFDPKLPEKKCFKRMNICKIDDSTIGYGEVQASPDGSRRVFFLKMDTEEWTLSATLRLFTPADVWDMCYLKVEDGTPCLLLCIPDDHRIMGVEMGIGKTRWERERQDMGENFEPRSICTNQNNCVFVADFGQRKIHLLAAADGAVIKRLDIGRYSGFRNIFAVRFHDRHLYIERKIMWHNMQEYAIMKFK